MTWRNQALNLADKDISFSFSVSQQGIILLVPCPVAATCCLFQVTSSNTFMPTSVTPSHSINFNTVTALSSGSRSSHSAPSRPVCFRISTRWSGVSSWSLALSNSQTSSASYHEFACLTSDSESGVKRRKCENDLNREITLIHIRIL